jgi:hypothetical protein
MVDAGSERVSIRMPDGQVLLTVPEAAEVWRRIGNIAISPGIYRRKCRSGELEVLGIEVSEGPRFLTDLDSLLAYFDREMHEMRKRLDMALAERREMLAGRGGDED